MIPLTYPPSEVIICTKDRPDDLARCVESILQQEVVPVITIIDASGTDGTARLCEEFRARATKLKYLRSIPHMTHQRNLGVYGLEDDSEIIHFLDDDVVLRPGYFTSILQVFSSDSDGRIGGVGGVIDNEPLQQPRLMHRIFMLTSLRDGALLRSGRNIHVYRATEPLQVDWLGGGTSSYRRQVFDDELFAESFEGYSYGEDIEFSYRVSRRWKLVVTPDAQLTHALSEVNRPLRYSLIKREIEFRYQFVRQYRGPRLSRRAFWWSVTGEVLLASIGALLKRDADKWVRARALVSGLKAVITRRGLEEQPIFDRDSDAA